MIKEVKQSKGFQPKVVDHKLSECLCIIYQQFGQKLSAGIDMVRHNFGILKLTKNDYLLGQQLFLWLMGCYVQILPTT